MNKESLDSLLLKTDYIRSETFKAIGNQIPPSYVILRVLSEIDGILYNLKKEGIEND